MTVDEELLEGAGAVPLLLLARRLGSLVWLERRLFELAGGWVAVTPEPAPKVHLARVAAHHGEWAGTWFGHVPAASNLEPEVFVAPASPALEGAIDALAALGDVDASIDRLAALQVLTTRLLDAQRVHLARCRPVADEAVSRRLRLHIVDLEHDASAGGVVLGELSVGAEAARRAETAAARASVDLRVDVVTPLDDT